MKIAAFTEGGYSGTVPREHPNMRTDLAWWCALRAIHHPIEHLPSMKDDEYDIGIMILPKNRKPLLNLPIHLNQQKSLVSNHLMCLGICTELIHIYFFLLKRM